MPGKPMIEETNFEKHDPKVENLKKLLNFDELKIKLD